MDRPTMETLARRLDGIRYNCLIVVGQHNEEHKDT